MPEVNLLFKYPKTDRNIKNRVRKKTEEVKQIARRFGWEYFDGSREYGYGGYTYNPRYWQGVVRDFQKHYGLTAKSRILDVGCGKGFMMHDFARLIPGIKILGIDISEYAVKNALPDMKSFIKVSDAQKLPFPDKSFDLVISINTIHNLPLPECKKALREIQRVSKRHSFISVDAYHTILEKKRLEDWNLTALTYMNVARWVKVFKETGFAGDYWWFIP